jgi:hypothetical protein
VVKRSKPELKWFDPGTPQTGIHIQWEREEDWFDLANVDYYHTRWIKIPNPGTSANSVIGREVTFRYIHIYHTIMFKWMPAEVMAVPYKIGVRVLISRHKNTVSLNVDLVQTPMNILDDNIAASDLGYYEPDLLLQAPLIMGIRDSFTILKQYRFTLMQHNTVSYKHYRLRFGRKGLIQKLKYVDTQQNTVELYTPILVMVARRRSDLVFS